MAGPQRIAYEGAVNLMTARDNERRAIFQGDPTTGALSACSARTSIANRVGPYQSIQGQVACVSRLMHTG
jgi:hypothetical protein